MTNEFVIEDFYIVEVNEGIYVNTIEKSFEWVFSCADKDFEVEYSFSFVNDFKEAERYICFDIAVEIAEKCGGIVRKYRVTHELLDCDEGRIK